MNVMVIDGETCETQRDERGQLDTSSGQVYDLGGQVINVESGSILDKFNLVNEDVFFGMPKSMNEAYYAEKIPQYLEEMRMGKRQIVDTWKMWKTVAELCQKHHVEAIVAHNAWFDVKTLNATIRYQTKSDLVCRAIMDKEGITEDSEEFTAAVDNALASYDLADLESAEAEGWSEEFIKLTARERICQDILVANCSQAG